jgi:hypothetical protein
VRGEGEAQPTSVHDSQEAAIAEAREIARREKSELLIHGRDGQIRSRDSHGHDPASRTG